MVIIKNGLPMNKQIEWRTRFDARTHLFAQEDLLNTLGNSDMESHKKVETPTEFSPESAHESGTNS